MINPFPIGIFDSGYGGLTVLKEIKTLLPQYDFMYFGDNARAPYGPRSFERVYQFTLQSVKWLLAQGCPLVILACNTASAKALRTIQQKYLPEFDNKKRVLGVIRPTTEIIGNYSTTKHIGILGTQGTVKSKSYLIEIENFFPQIRVFQHGCPMWVPLVENNEYNSQGAGYFVKKDINLLLKKSPQIDTVLLACTHYPLLLKEIRQYLPESIKIISQGPIVAKSLKDYLTRHPEIEKRCSKNGNLQFFTTDCAKDFDKHSKIFFGQKVNSMQVDL